jgi:hypothetical protein
MQPKASTVQGAGIPCIEVSQGGRQFQIYIQDGQSLCFQAVVRRPTPGFTDISSHWNVSRRFARVIPCLDGYLMRFEAEISHGVTRENLRALLGKFSSSVMEFSLFVEGPLTAPLP